MKIFALNLSMEFVSHEAGRNYGYELLSFEDLLTQFPHKIEFKKQKFYIQGEANKAFVKEVFKLQTKTDWREIPLSICFIFNTERDKEKFLKRFIKLFKQVDAAGGLVENEKGEYLCIFNRNVWTLPKGHVEKNEEVAVAAIREVKEETGLKEVDIMEKMPTTYHTFKKKKKWILKITYWYKMHASSHQKIEPQAEEHIEDVAWMNRQQWLEVADQSYPLTRDLFVTEFTQRLN